MARGPHRHMGVPCTDPDCGFLKLGPVTDDLPIIDDATALVYARGLAYYIAVAVKRTAVPDDALTMIEDLRRYFESRSG